MLFLPRRVSAHSLIADNLWPSPQVRFVEKDGTLDQAMPSNLLNQCKLH